MDWHARRRERIAAAEMLRDKLPKEEQAAQRRHIASLKRALNLGPEGLREAARRAQQSRKPSDGFETPPDESRD
jgi:hypothetical protein